jgi:hypothetical protein
VSEFKTFDDATPNTDPPFQTADGLEMPPDPSPIEECPAGCSVIKIITGPKGQVRGSKIFVNGKPVERIRLFSVTGDLDQGHWETTIIQGVGGADV